LFLGFVSDLISGERTDLMTCSTNKSLLVLVSLLCFLVAAYSQNSEKLSDATAEGVALYERGDTEGAIKLLSQTVKKSKEDARAWHYLGLAHMRAGNFKAAREVLDKAITVRTKIITEQFFGREDREWRGDQLATFKTLLSDQIETQTRWLKTLDHLDDLAKGQLGLQRSRVQANCVEQSSKIVDGHKHLRWADMNIEKVRILSKPEPQYPGSALRNNVSGNVILRAMFAADRSVRYIEPIRAPDRALLEEAIRVAKLIRFTPQRYCGNAVSSPIQLEYSFNLGFR
jgi:tetratricopeptide (TPR) repeat protein